MIQVYFVLFVCVIGILLSQWHSHRVFAQCPAYFLHLFAKTYRGKCVRVTHCTRIRQKEMSAKKQHTIIALHTTVQPACIQRTNIIAPNRNYRVLTNPD